MGRRGPTGGISGTNQYTIRNKRTICWDCAKACGGCNWSARLEPVEGWEAEETLVTIQKGSRVDSMCVTKCPEFERDAMNFGEERLKVRARA